MKMIRNWFLGAKQNYMLVAGFIERIGDYVTNISEWIIYLDKHEMTELTDH